MVSGCLSTGGQIQQKTKRQSPRVIARNSPVFTGFVVSDEQYIALMKKLRPNVIVSPELVEMFKKEYPEGSAKLMQLKMMIGLAPIVKKIRHKS